MTVRAQPIEIRTGSTASTRVQCVRRGFAGDVYEGEEVAAEAAHVLSRHGEDGIRRDRRVDRVAAPAQHVDAGFGREVIDGAHHAVGREAGRERPSSQAASRRVGLCSASHCQNRRFRRSIM